LFCPDQAEFEQDFASYYYFAGVVVKVVIMRNLMIA
jgi:hypothetical protein